MISAKDTDPRTFMRIPDKRRTRRTCPFDCKGNATHAGLANGVCLMRGCEFHVRQWVKNPDGLLRRPAMCENCQKRITGRAHESDDGYWLCDPCWAGLQSEVAANEFNVGAYIDQD